MRLLLISNSTQHGSGYLDHCADEIKSFLGEVGKLVFVPFAVHDWDTYTKAARDRFQKLGYSVTGVHEKDQPLQNIQDADAIFTGGGNTFRLLNELYRQNLIPEIREKVRSGTPYIGSSAGTNIACPTIETTNDMPIVYPPSFEGLNLVSFSINCHYFDPLPNSTHQGETREQRIKEFHEVNDHPVIGLREGSMIRIEGQKATLKGVTRARLFQKSKEPIEFSAGSDLSFLLS